MVTAGVEEAFVVLLQSVQELWELMGADTVACVRDCLAVFTAADADTAVPSQLAALQRRGLLSPNSTLVLRQVSELIGCSGALRLLDAFERRWPPRGARPTDHAPSPSMDDDSFRSALDFGGEHGRNTSEERCPWQWPAPQRPPPRRPSPQRPPLQRTVSEVLNGPWGEPELMDGQHERASGRQCAARPPAQQQLHWMEKVLAWEVHPEPEPEAAPRAPAAAPRAPAAASRAPSPAPCAPSAVAGRRRSRDTGLMSRSAVSGMASLLTSSSSLLRSRSSGINYVVCC
ncbi:hypothetical protein FJT64_023563 [Amphibalanus amphitrite]|uniref:Uncharacterized protein n=1 Tax=Amphibalanus amphitrite TaxID=1232801 RepID=A0A6A4WFE0_AMPAM|nr:hypothetical protein FJT64_023563 [Amphibalanus amphitrite]